MTLTIDITPEMETRLQQEATKLGQEPAVFALTALHQVLGLTGGANAAVMAEWQGASHRLLQEYWDNDEDAVYDTL